MNWQPIETAPKDGTEIILGMFREEFVDPIVMNSCWIDGEERGCYWHDWQGLPTPTHWAPLVRPTPPKECDCGAATTGKWADKHSPGCASLRTDWFLRGYEDRVRHRKGETQFPDKTARELYETGVASAESAMGFTPAP